MRPVNRDNADRGAPVSGGSPEYCFWDHLGATRAEEYATEDILDLCPTPVDIPPIQAPEEFDARTPMGLDRGEASRPAAPPGTGSDQVPPAPFMPQPNRHIPAASLGGPTHRLARAAQSRRARFSYRLQRMWLTPFYRALITRGLPIALALGLTALLLTNAQNRAQIVGLGEAAYAALVDRPEFMVTSVTLSPVAPELDRSVRTWLTAQLPQSSFRLDLSQMRAEIEAYDSVAEAALRFGANGDLVVTINERVPVVVWHSGQSRELLDIDGHRVAILSDTAALPDLPLIAGDGARDHVREALALLDAAQPLAERLRGLVRVGARRWDVVLDRDQRIRLPEPGAMQALERILALDDAQDLLARDVLSVDLRNPTRPMLHVTPGALETLRAIRTNPSEASQ
jgi:cell division septal protein FtsQ